MIKMLNKSIGIKDHCEQPCKYWNSNLVPLQEQQVLFTTEPSPQFLVTELFYEVSLQASFSNPSRSNVLLRPVISQVCSPSFQGLRQERHQFRSRLGCRTEAFLGKQTNKNLCSLEKSEFCTDLGT